MVAIAQHFGVSQALTQLKRSEVGLDQTFNRLSSGERLTQSSDDTFDFQISNRLRSDIKAYRELQRGHFESVNFLQIAEGHLEEMNNVLTRVAELATQAASGTTGPDNSNAKIALDAEYQSLLEDITQINDEVRFSNVTVFGSSGTSITVNLTPEVLDATETMQVSTSSISLSSLGLSMTDLTTEATASAVLEQVNIAIEQINRQRGRLGTAAIRIMDNMDYLDQRMINMQGQESMIRDADIADETVALTKYQILNQSNVSVLAQANLQAESVLQLLG